MIVRYILAWIPMVFIAMANGALREWTYGKYMAELRAHQLSSVTGGLLFYLYTWLIIPHLKLESARQAITAGMIWLCLTVAFEFLFGHYLAKHSWSRLLHDYNVLAGRVWLPVLMAVALAPYVIYRYSSTP